MSQRMRHELTYEATPEQVYSMLSTEAFRVEVCESQHVLFHDVSITEEPTGGMAVRVEQTQPAQGLPSVATKIVGDTITIVQAEDWSSETDAALEVSIPGKPGQVTGSISLQQTGSTTTEVVDVEIKVGVPLVGGKLEKLIADLLRKALVAENQVGRRWLA